MNTREKIARRAALEIKDGDVVNFGIGLPELASDYIPKEYDVWVQGDHGVVARQKNASEGMEDPELIGAGNQYIQVEPGASFFDSAMAFAVSRGGHLDVAVLGALQVDEKGSVASHYIPGKMVAGMGGAMDIIAGAKKVIIVSSYKKKDGSCILTGELTLPCTAQYAVDMIITELCVIYVTERGLEVDEIADGYTLEMLQEMTDAKLYEMDAGNDCKTV